MLEPVHPSSLAGQLNTDIMQLKNEVGRKADDYKVTSLNSKLDALVCAVRDVSTVCDGILSRLQACEEKLPKNH